MEGKQHPGDEERVDETAAASLHASNASGPTLGADQGAVDAWLPAQPRPVESLEVGRVLPARARRMVGPFTFFDHLGPSRFLPGHGVDVRPHPHIGLATVTYLLEGELLHRDSLGTVQLIRQGAVNWMTAGRGIVHSERTPKDARAHGHRLHGLQLWVALPRASEDDEPAFSHHAVEQIPERQHKDARVRVLAGEAYGLAAPTPVASPLFYVDVQLATGSHIEVPGEYAERAAYVLVGDVSCGAAAVIPRLMAVFRTGSKVVLEAHTPARLVLIGGAPLDGPRFIWWNFVSSSKDRIVQAARAWRERRFPTVFGDEVDFVPLLDEPRFSPDGG